MHCNTHKVGDKLVPALTIGFISFFLLSSLIDLSLVTSVIQSMFSSVTSQFGVRLAMVDDYQFCCGSAYRCNPIR